MFENIIQLFPCKRGKEINKTPGFKKFYLCKCSSCKVEKYRSRSNMYESYIRGIIDINKNNYKCLHCNAIQNGKLYKTNDDKVLKNVPSAFHLCLTNKMKNGMRVFSVCCSICNNLKETNKHSIIRSKVNLPEKYVCKSCHLKLNGLSTTYTLNRYLKNIHKSFHKYLSNKRNKCHMRLFINVPCSICKSLNITTKYNLKEKSIKTYKCKICRSILNGKKCRKYPKKIGDRTTTYETLMFKKYGYDKNKWKCENCSVTKKEMINNKFPYNTIQIHHIDKNRTNDVESNLKLLCFSCHKKEH